MALTGRPCFSQNPLDEWITKEGFSIDLSDFTFKVDEDLPEGAPDPLEEMMDKVYMEMYSKLMVIEKDKEMSERIKNLEVHSALNITKQVGMEIATKYQSKDNPVYIMGELGANTKREM